MKGHILHSTSSGLEITPVLILVFIEFSYWYTKSSRAVIRSPLRPLLEAQNRPVLRWSPVMACQMQGRSWRQGVWGSRASINVNPLLILNGLRWLGCFANYLWWWRKVGEGYFLTSEILWNKKESLKERCRRERCKTCSCKMLPRPPLDIGLVSTLLSHLGIFPLWCRMG